MFNLQEMLWAHLHSLLIHDRLFNCIFVAFLLDTIKDFIPHQYSNLLCAVSRSNGTGFYQHKNAFCYFFLLSLFSFRQPLQKKAIYSTFFFVKNLSNLCHVNNFNAVLS